MAPSGSTDATSAGGSPVPDDRVVGKSGCTVAQAKAKFSVEHFNPIRARAEQEHLLRVLARVAPPKLAEPLALVRPRRTYGPHCEDSAPTHVLITRGGRSQHAPIERDVPVPVPRALVEQRRNLNTRAASSAHHQEKINA